MRAWRQWCPRCPRSRQMPPPSCWWLAPWPMWWKTSSCACSLKWALTVFVSSRLVVRTIRRLSDRIPGCCWHNRFSVIRPACCKAVVRPCCQRHFRWGSREPRHGSRLRRMPSRLRPSGSKRRLPHQWHGRMRRSLAHGHSLRASRFSSSLILNLRFLWPVSYLAKWA